MATGATLQLLVCQSSHHRWSPPLLIAPPVALAPLVFSNFVVFKDPSCVFPSSSHLLFSAALRGQCSSVVIAIVVGDLSSVRAGWGGGQCCLLHRQRAALLLAVPLCHLPTSREAACDALLAFVRAAAARSRSAGSTASRATQPLTAHLQLLGDIFACSSTSLLHFQQ